MQAQRSTLEIYIDSATGDNAYPVTARLLGSNQTARASMMFPFSTEEVARAQGWLFALCLVRSATPGIAVVYGHLRHELPLADKDGVVCLPIGWEPDLNDGVRLNIRPWLTVPAVGKKGAGVLRDKPNIKWEKDRGKDVASAPWFGVFKGERINDWHLILEEKVRARG